MERHPITCWPSAPVLAAAALLLVHPPAAGAAEPEGGGSQQELSEVVVTGSRIARRDYESQSPIVTVQSETFEDRSSVGIEAALQQLPQFAPSANAQSNSGSSTPFPSPTAAPGAVRSSSRPATWSTTSRCRWA